MCCRRGQSETVGIVLLVGVVVVLVFGIGVVFIAEWQAEADDTKRVHVASDVTATSVILEHEGGDSLVAGDVLVILRGESEERATLADGSFTQERGIDDTRFAPGDRWNGTHGVTGDPVRLLVIHEPSDVVLHTELYTVK
jgi:flagellin-like protein